jgi:hypothetical protein
MANRFARCLNTDYCSLGDRRLVMRLGDDEPFFCPECAHPLESAPPWGNGARLSLSVLGVAAMSVLAVVSGLMVARDWPHTVYDLSPVRVPGAMNVASVPPPPSLMEVMAGAVPPDTTPELTMPEPARLFLAAAMDDWLPHRAGDYVLRTRRMRPPRVDPLAVEARAALEDGVPRLPAPPAPPASMPWRQAMIMAALVSPGQPLSGAAPPAAPSPPDGSPPAGPVASFTTKPASTGGQAPPPPPGAQGSGGDGKRAIRPQTSLVPTALPAIRLAAVMTAPAARAASDPPPLKPVVPILRQALHADLAQSTPPPSPAAPVAQPMAAERQTQIALEDGLIRAVSPPADDIGMRLLRTLPGSVAEPGRPVPRAAPVPAAKPPVATSAGGPIHKGTPVAVAAKPARMAGLPDRKAARHAAPARKQAVAPAADREAAAPAPPPAAAPPAAIVASIAPPSLPDKAAAPAAAPQPGQTIALPNFKMSYGPLNDVKLQDANGLFMTARPSAAKPARGSLLVDCVIETTGVPSNCHVLHAENAAGVQDAVLAMLVSGMVHKTPKTEGGHLVRARQTWTMEFAAQSQK